MRLCSSIVAIAVLFAGDCGFGNEVPASPSPADEIATLKKENAALREENQRLRRLLATPVQPGTQTAPPTSAPTAVPRAPAGATADGQKAEVLFWLSSTGKRHNPKCRYFQTTKGQPCGPNDGVACKICGG